MLHSKTVAADLAVLLKEHGVEYAIISPGSRNAPLALSLAQHSDIECISVPDERVAAFYALGITQKTGKPVVVSCTSGSALLNFAPAAAEALYQQIPIIIVSADRPPEWIDQGDGQTVRQSGALNTSVKKWLNLMPDDENPDSRWFNQRQINYALISATSHPKGPVHINIPLREPLYKVQQPESSSIKKIELVKPAASIDNQAFDLISLRFKQFKKVMIIAGQMLPNTALKKALEAFAKLPNVVMLTESHSNLFSEGTINCIDRDLAAVPEDDNSFYPDLLISVGHNIISKKIKFYLRKVEPLEHWHFGPSALLEDTFKKLTLSVEAEPEIIFERLITDIAGFNRKENNFKTNWLKAKQNALLHAKSYVEKQDWSDLLVFKHLMDWLPSNSVLQMGNSSVVRYIQLFERNNKVLYFGNRGTSGIDGSTSTAAGFSLVEEKQVYLITGDISFFYDSNAFWCNKLAGNFKVILINNQGGGIFRIIDGPDIIPDFETFLETTHQNNAKGICKAYDLNYLTAHNFDTLNEGLKALGSTENQKPTVLEIFTPRLNNAGVLKGLFKHIRSKIMND
jgi:2-succinyl-5-enolpyruvyl-6-hydroxy-3-cyclohexene-1-carboxylate synthase